MVEDGEEDGEGRLRFLLGLGDVVVVVVVVVVVLVVVAFEVEGSFDVERGGAVIVVVIEKEDEF